MSKLNISRTDNWGKVSHDPKIHLFICNRCKAEILAKLKPARCTNCGYMFTLRKVF